MTPLPRRPAPTLVAGLLAVAGLALIIGAVILATASGPSLRTFAVSTVVGQTPPVPRAPSTLGGPSVSTKPTVKPVPFAPAQLQIPTLGITAPVAEVFSNGGQLPPPADTHLVGWWAASQLPGSARGTTVLVGHVDAASGPGALFALRNVQPRAPVQVSSGGQQTNYQVDSLTYYPKTTGLPPSLFSTNGPAQLVLISCGGSFDKTARSYRDNIVVTAHAIQPNRTG